ncbi:MAG: hypothetical protein M0C28_34210 [Candidatus Moduliflexus flocculans]|nr:hypothetical protein [Candidatus Moduliflexus flocculans]
MKRIHWPTSVRRDQLDGQGIRAGPASRSLALPRYAQECPRCDKPASSIQPRLSIDLLLHAPPQGATAALHARVFHQHCRLAGALLHRTAPRRGCGDRAPETPTRSSLPNAVNGRKARSWKTLAFLQAREHLSRCRSLVSAQIGQLPQGSSAILITPMVMARVVARRWTVSSGATFVRSSSC